MKRKHAEILSWIGMLLISSILLFASHSVFSRDVYVSIGGNDSNSGTWDLPFATLKKAIAETQRFACKESITIWVAEGTYYLTETLELDDAFSGTSEHPFTISALPGANVIVKGSTPLDGLQWKEYKHGIYVTEVPDGLQFDQLFVNNERHVRARFSNYDYQNPLRGGDGYQLVTGGTNQRYDEWFTYDPEKFTQKEWKNPKTGIVHAFQSHNWGNMQYRIKSIDREKTNQ